MSDRRRFLQMLGGVAVAAGLPRLPKVRGARIERVGLQLYTVRHEMEKDVEATIVVRGGADPEVRRDAEGPVPALTEIFRKRRETPVEVGMAPIDAVPRRIRPGKN